MIVRAADGKYFDAVFAGNAGKIRPQGLLQRRFDPRAPVLGAEDEVDLIARVSVRKPCRPPASAARCARRCSGRAGCFVRRIPNGGALGWRNVPGSPSASPQGRAAAVPSQNQPDCSEAGTMLRAQGASLGYFRHARESARARSEREGSGTPSALLQGRAAAVSSQNQSERSEAGTSFSAQGVSLGTSPPGNIQPERSEAGTIFARP